VSNSGVSGGGGSTNQGTGASGNGQVSLGSVNQVPVVNNNNGGGGRQPRPLFKMPSLRLPNLSDFFGL
jgi:hypothetical protein